MKVTGVLSRLIQFLTTESSFKMMKNAFYFMFKAHSVPDFLFM